MELPKINKFSRTREVAIKIMYEVMYDNGWVNRFQPEKFSPMWIKRFEVVLQPLLSRHPVLLSDEALEVLVTADYDTVQRLYSDNHIKQHEYEPFEKVLNDYFDDSGRT